MIITHSLKLYIYRQTASLQEGFLPLLLSLCTVRLTVCSMLWCVSVRACQEIVLAKIMQTCSDEQSTTNNALKPFSSAMQHSSKQVSNATVYLKGFITQFIHT